MLEDIALSGYRSGWFSMDELEFAIGELLTAGLAIEASRLGV